MTDSITQQIQDNQDLLDRLRSKRSEALESILRFDEAHLLTDVIIAFENNNIELKSL